VHAVDAAGRRETTDVADLVLDAANQVQVDVEPLSQETHAPDGSIPKVFNEIKKYAVSRSAGVDTSWQGSLLLRDIADVKRLRNEDGPNLLTQGSTELVDALLAKTACRRQSQETRRTDESRRRARSGSRVRRGSDHPPKHREAIEPSSREPPAGRIPARDASSM
jgi:hypothetical protein